MKKSNLDHWIQETEDLSVLTREGLEALQLERLNALLHRLKARGGRCQELPDSLSSLDQLSGLPFTTPQMLSEHPGQFLLTSQAEVSRVISGTTSGTTGLPKRVFYTQRDTDHTVGFFAAGISEMLRPGQTCMIAFPFSGPFGLGDLIAQAVKKIGGIPIAAGFGITYADLIRLVRQEQPETYIGFPTALLGLLRMYGAHFPIQRALLSADACPKGVMDALEQALGSRLFPHYGSRETALGGAITCPAHEGMHLRENHILAEIVDRHGHPLPHGQWGELVITTIGMEAMPLLRYRTGDFTRILPTPCPCGSVTIRLDRVSRASDGPVDMETLDSTLYPTEDLIDYKASFDGTLHIQALVLDTGCAQRLYHAAKAQYPELSITVSVQTAAPTDRPMYPGKRYLVMKGDTV